MSVRRVGEVLYVNDLAVAKDERLRPGCSLAVCRCPGERRRCTVSLYLDRIDSVVAFAKLPSLLDPEQERLTGLVLAVSGRHWLPEAQGALPAMPRNVVAHQGDKRLGVALRERVVGLPKNVGRHGGILTASTRSFQLRAAPPRTRRRCHGSSGHPDARALVEQPPSLVPRLGVSVVGAAEAPSAPRAGQASAGTPAMPSSESATSAAGDLHGLEGGGTPPTG